MPVLGDSLYFSQPRPVHTFTYPSTCCYSLVVFFCLWFSVSILSKFPQLWKSDGLPSWFLQSSLVSQISEFKTIQFLFESLISCCLSCLYLTSYLEAEASMFCLNKFPTDFISVKKSCLFIWTVLPWCSFPDASVEKASMSMIITSLSFPFLRWYQSSEQATLQCLWVAALCILVKVSLLLLLSWSSASYLAKTEIIHLETFKPKNDSSLFNA